ncbi:hydantoinase/oxoprolinase family protein [Pikeienuella sp. HZG-20]|uniref:hydantoinase/oxoprolinase family protein n=1 Tax=Paludibacillus litoralis TaxID=3133267 RepID=UPI0030ECF53F
MAILLGVDTGGTFTDAVVYDEAAARILGKAKALTTHQDLGRGVAAAAAAALAAAEVGAERIALVSLSTTLATNALVEGLGDPAALVMIGFGREDLQRAGLAKALGSDPALLIAGGHRSDGAEAAPLDEGALREGARAAASRVAGFAVAAVFGVRNPEHEARAAEIVREETGRPATCSHALSARLGGPRRALTTLLNARLVGMIDRLIEGAETRLAGLGVSAPLMVVKGDGALMSAAIARARPIETILSGPAASLVGAAHLTGLTRAIVADIGGTTTDIAVLAGGRPRLDPAGARVGGWRTMVEAVAMRTHGLGGDSEVTLDEASLEARLVLGPRRAVPISLFAREWAGAHDALDRQLRREQADPADGVFVRPGARRAGLESLGARAADLMGRIGAGAALETLDLAPRGRLALKRLLADGYLRRVAFTPTDAAHVLGLHDEWDREAAGKAAALFARRKAANGERAAPDGAALARMTIDALTRRSAELALEAALAEDGFEADGMARAPLAAAALDRRRGFAAAELSLTAPLIGLGASAPVYYPAVGRLAGAETTIPEDAGVANAVGAVVGRVEAKAEALILSAEDEEGYEVLAGGPPARVETLGAAKAMAETWARGAALARAVEAGADAPEVAASWEEKRATVRGRATLAEARVTAVASGRPRF